MPDAKFASSSLSSFGDMTSQNFLLKKGMSYRIWICNPGKWVQLQEKMSFYVQNHSF